MFVEDPGCFSLKSLVYGALFWIALLFERNANFLLGKTCCLRVMKVYHCRRRDGPSHQSIIVVIRATMVVPLTFLQHKTSPISPQPQGFLVCLYMSFSVQDGKTCHFGKTVPTICKPTPTGTIARAQLKPKLTNLWILDIMSSITMTRPRSVNMFWKGTSTSNNSLAERRRCSVDCLMRDRHIEGNWGDAIEDSVNKLK